MPEVVNLLFPCCSTQTRFNHAERKDCCSSVLVHGFTAAAVAIVCGFGAAFVAYGATQGMMTWTLCAGSGAALAMGAASYVAIRCLFGKKRVHTVVQTQKLSPATQQPKAAPPVKDTLPKYVCNQKGEVSSAHLNYYIHKEKPANRDAIEKWASTQRKFPGGSGLLNSRPPGCVELDAKSMQTLLVDRDGYSVPFGLYADPARKNEIFVPDELVKDVEPYENYGFQQGSEQITIGYYKDGKCMIQQRTRFGSSAACVAMWLQDHSKGNGIKYNLNNLDLSASSDEKVLKDLLQQNGHGLLVLNEHTAPSLKQAIQNNDSLIVAVDWNSHIGHTILLDAIDDDFVTIRDPFHGWRFKMHTQAFFSEVKPKAFYAVT